MALNFSIFLSSFDLLIYSRYDVLFADSSLRVKDVIKEFHPRGRLAQHSFGEVSP